MTRMSGTPVVSSAEGRRERKRQASRERLYSAAIALFLEHGFDATPVDQIANPADVARATAFNYVPQKVTYLEEWGRRGWRWLHITAINYSRFPSGAEARIVYRRIWNFGCRRRHRVRFLPTGENLPRRGRVGNGHLRRRTAPCGRGRGP